MVWKVTVTLRYRLCGTSNYRLKGDEQPLTIVLRLVTMRSWVPLSPSTGLRLADCCCHQALLVWSKKVAIRSAVSKVTGGLASPDFFLRYIHLYGSKAYEKEMSTLYLWACNSNSSPLRDLHVLKSENCFSCRTCYIQAFLRVFCLTIWNTLSADILLSDG